MPAKLNLLLISQDKGNAAIIQDALASEGFRTTAVPSAKEAAALLPKKDFEIVFLDNEILDETGARSLVEEMTRSGKRPFLILLTSGGSETPPQSLLSVRIFASIRKPVEPDYLRFSVMQTLRIRDLNERIQDLENRMIGMSLKEPETGLYNFRYLEERLAGEFKRATRYVFPLSLVLVEADSSRKLHKNLDPASAQEALARAAKFLLRFARGNDIVTHYGGTRFLIMLPDTGKQGALIFGERLLEALKQESFEREGKKISFDVSIGVANYPADGVKTEANLLDLASRALINALKHKGQGVYAFRGISREDVLNIMSRKAKENKG